MNGDPGSILIVDDEEMNREGLARRLQRHGYAVTPVGGGREAIELLGVRRFDLMLLDVMMPGMNGLEVLKFLRRVDSLLDLPIIMVTAKGESADVVEALELGANDYVTKPLDLPVTLARIRTQLALKRAEEALREADRRKDEFLATLAHELRNPLAPIRNALQVLKLAGGGGAAAELARALMERQLTQVVRLVDDLMDLSRISRGKIDLRRERVRLAAAVESAVEASRPLIERMGHELTVTLPPQPVTLDADPARLAQVFGNLLNNAAKYTERGGQIWLTAERQGGDAVVAVRDTGVGIPADQLPHIFQMFTQVERSLERSQGGLGIGLCLVRRLVEMHGGSIEARSEGAGWGSEFVVRLPAVGASEPQELSRADEPAAPKSLRILVVDDNRDGADSLSTMLRLLGNDTRTAYDGRSGVAAAGEFRPDVVLLDIALPGLNGYEACRHIREQPWGLGVVLVAVTGWGQEGDRRRSHEAGFDHHLVKPVDPNTLMKLLSELSDPARR